MIAIATCPQCRSPVDPSEAVKYKSKSYHKQCLDELRAKAMQQDTLKAQRINDPELKALSDYLCGLFSIPCMTPLLTKQVSDLRANHSYADILMGIRYFYEKDKGCDKPLPDPPSIGIVPYIMNDAKAFAKQLEAASEANKNATINTKAVVVRIRPPDAAIPPPYDMWDL